MTEARTTGTAALPTEGTLTFLQCDIDGSTALQDRLGATYKGLLDRYHDIVATSADVLNGVVSGSESDGVVVVFTNVVAAAEAALEIVDGLGRETWPDESEVRPRIGLHTGRATMSSSGYFGLEVNRARAVASASNGGQILVSAITRQLLENSGEADDWHFEDLGLFVLAGITQPERLSQLSLERGVPAAAPRARPYRVGNLPTADSPMVGRNEDLRVLGEMLGRDSVRLLTVTGPGGTGKTRVAVELGAQLESAFPGGIHFVDLSGVREEGQVLPAIGRSLGILEAEARTIPEALGAVVGSSSVLVILDNMEQVIGAGVGLGDLLQEAPHLKMLVTSRVPLRVRWEHEYPLSPLQVPEPGVEGEALDEVESVALFVSRAQAVTDFELDASNSATVAEICRRLDGLPLAIELAAARLRTMDPKELLDRLSDRFTVLTDDLTEAPERHRTLRAAIEWSHDLLEADEKMLFRRLAVFAGGWSLEAAEWVCADEADRSLVLERLGDLVAKSLAVFYLDDHGEPRYRMLESLRDFGLEQLRASGEEAELRQRHRAWCLDLAHRLEAGSPTPQFPVLLDEMEREMHNVREALGWAAEGDDPAGWEEGLLIVGLAWLFWDIRGLVKEGLNWAKRFLELSDAPTPARAGGLMAAGWLSQLQGDPEGSTSYINQATDLRRELGDEYWLSWALSVKGMLYYNQFEPDVAKAAFEESIAIADSVDFFWLSEGWAPYGLGHVAWLEGDLETARRSIETTLEVSTRHELLWGIGHAQLSLSLLAFFSGELGEAATRIHESIRIRQRIRDSRGIADCLGILAVYASSGQDHELAATLLGAAELQRDATGQMLVPWLQPFYQEAVATASAGLGDETYHQQVAAGRSMAIDDVIDLALARLGSPVGAAGPA